ncbi:MAG: peptidoglycan DD-metalloendopeptidase family protein [Patescibacteria group bacterium]
MITDDTPEFPFFLILSFYKTFASVLCRLNRNAYLASTLTTLVGALSLASSLAFPITTNAYWLPWTISFAGNPGGEPPIIHDSSIPLLQAAVNSDPNPEKGGSDIQLTEGSALMANSGPEGTLADIDMTSSAGQITTYVVRPGDTISNIARNFGVSANTILWANNLTTKSKVTPGTTLVILPVSGLQHKVTKGETLAGIAKKFKADAGDVASYNGLSVGDGLTVGDILIIPGGELSVASSKTATSGKTKTNIKQGGGLVSILKNPYRGGSGAEIDGYYTNPVPGGLLTQGIHGWNGVDLGAPAGTPVYAAAGGTVIVSRVGGWNGGYGNYIVIDHGNGTQTLYSHLSSDNVSVGQTVSRAAAIGAVGHTGEATGNHLHFEVRGARNPFAGCTAMTHCSPK